MPLFFRKFEPIKDCFTSVLNKCPETIERLDTEWVHVYDNISCVCSQPGSGKEKC